MDRGKGFYEKGLELKPFNYSTFFNYSSDSHFLGVSSTDHRTGQQ